MNFSFAYPTWFLLFCLCVGFIFSFALYFKKKNNFPFTWQFVLVILTRFFTGAILVFLLLSPILKYLQKKEDKPTIAFIQDNSASIKNAFKKIDSVAYQKNVRDLIAELQKDYNVKTFSLGNQLKDSLHFEYNENGSDISSPLETIMTTLENENLGAVILASDGIYNKGMSPLNLTYPFKGAVYSIGLGDTTIQRDALVARVFANKMVYLGDQFAIRSDVSAYACKGSSVTVSVFSHSANRVVATQNFSVTEERFSKSIETIIDARSVGVQHYTISISKVDGEQNIANNAQDVYVEVIDSKENVLIVANAPHPDIFALKEALTKNKNFKVDIKTAQKVDANISDYNLVVLHNLPSVNYNVNSILEQAKKMGISLWFITGSQTAIPLFNQAQNCLQIAPRGMSLNDASANLNKEFSYFTLSNTTGLLQVPPLATPFGEYTTGANTQVLMTQKIGSVNTNYPLWIVQQNNAARVGVTAGEGLWRWRLYDYQQHKNQNLVDEYILKTAQFLSVKHDKKQFRTTIQKSVFTESEPITFDAELYNENYELINTPDVNLTITDEANTKKKYSLNKEGNSYSLSLGNLAAGKYAYTSQTAYNGKNYSASGNFSVVAINIEDVNTTADFGMLNQLAKNYGGEFVYPSEINSIKEKIKNNQAVKTILRTQVNTEPLINWKWLFGLLIFLLSIEWFIRKYTGNY